MTVNHPLTEQIIGCCYRVANMLGYGFLEKVYENALAHEFRKARAPFEQKKGIEVFYDGVNVGNFVADLVVANRVIVELKAAQAIDDAHVAQCLQLSESNRPGGMPPGELRKEQGRSPQVHSEPGWEARGDGIGRKGHPIGHTSAA